ncbi:MAG: hypothetical protein ACRD2I_12180, partial [Vicinamibacterales bacterium]
MHEHPPSTAVGAEWISTVTTTSDCADVAKTFPALAAFMHRVEGTNDEAAFLSWHHMNGILIGGSIKAGQLCAWDCLTAQENWCTRLKVPLTGFWFSDNGERWIGEGAERQVWDV